MIYNRACLYTNYKGTTKTTNGKCMKKNVDCLHDKYVDSVPCVPLSETFRDT